MKIINKVCIVGAGQMGRQIALNTAIHGIKVSLTDNSSEVLADASSWIASYLAGRIEKGRMTKEETDKAQANVSVVADLEDALKDADLVIEAIIEKEEIKRELFAKVDKMAPPTAIIATNSSAMPSSMFIDVVSNPARLANLHYFNPALVMQLVEVVQGEHTSQETIDTLMDFCKKTGKSPIWLRKEIRGFVCNRILRAVADEALFLVEEGVATPQEIDIATEKGLNYPMGPFRLMDLTGIDIQYYSAQSRIKSGETVPGFALLEEKFNAKEWGRKTGKGWYEYTKK